MGWYRSYRSNNFGWAPYVPVAERRRRAATKVTALKKKGRVISPVEIAGREIADTFWGRAWCGNLERYSDYENRLPRGRTYARNGSVIDLQIAAGKVTALVSGTEIYEVGIKIKALDAKKWQDVKAVCSGKIDSVVELLQGKLSKGVMEIITSKDKGLFPAPRQIEFECSCPDWAGMCKHVAAALYGVGARLDQCPELLFVLRKVDHTELITGAAAGTLTRRASRHFGRVLDKSAITGIFGIELDERSGKAVPAARKRGGGKRRHKIKVT